jgi:uncharacterized protein YndB with AHSA1/START domain
MQHIILLFTFLLLPYQALTAQTTITQVSWPEGFAPAQSKFYVRNEIEINAPPEKVWNILIDAQKWESWYQGAENLRLCTSGDSMLKAGSVFEWKTMGLNFVSTIKEFTPNRVLAWESNKRCIQGYHAWLIIPTATGCRVITEETQNGWLTFFEKTFQRNKLKRLHDVWLGELKKKAESVN